MQPESGSIQPDVLLLDVTVRGDPPSVWKALVDAEKRRGWWSYLSLRAELGGELLETWRDDEGREQQTRGSVLAIEPERRLRCSWQDDGWAAPTEVEITLTGRTDATQVHLRHSGWHVLPEGQRLLDAHRAGWAMHLSNLKSFVEAEQTNF